MSTPAATLLFALLAVAAQVAVLSVAVVTVLSRSSPTAARRYGELRGELGDQAMALACVVAAVATAGSLYLSEAANFTPCRLCWYQRAAMYPLVALTALAAWRRTTRLRLLVVAVSAVGACISAYHVALERFPSLESSTTCDLDNPCSVIWVERLGYLTIPTMALSGFLLICTLALLARPTAPLTKERDVAQASASRCVQPVR